MKNIIDKNGIPISPLLSSLDNTTEYSKDNLLLKKRLFRVSVLSVSVAIVICFIAKFLVLLINIVTNISFYGIFQSAYHSPAGNHLGLWVILIPVIGGILVGFMALFGSKAIRGHGIPE